MAYIPEDQERDREELYGTPITALLEPRSCNSCKVLSDGIAGSPTMKHLQFLVNMAERHVNRRHWE